MKVISQPATDAASHQADTVIARLYQEAEAALPSPERPIVPLHRLLGELPLTCRELPELSSLEASHFLMARGGSIAPLRGANDEPLAGFLFANAGGGAIFTRREDPIARRRFSIAHELGHYLLHLPLVLQDAQREGLEDEIELIEALPPAESPSHRGINESEAEAASTGQVSVRGHGSDGHTVMTASLPPMEEMERQADAFAGALLMPAELVCALARRYRPHFGDADLIWRLSTELLVSRAAMRVRLRHLGLLRESGAAWN